MAQGLVIDHPFPNLFLLTLVSYGGIYVTDLCIERDIELNTQKKGRRNPIEIRCIAELVQLELNALEI